MGLLDNIDGDTILSGLLSAGAASGAKGPYLARVAAGLAQGERFKQGRAEQARQRSQDEMQAEYKQLQKRKLEMDMAREQRAQQEQDSMRGLAKQFMIPGAPASAGMPANEMDSGMDMGAVAAKPAGYDFAGYANALSAINPSAGLAIKALLAKDKPKMTVVAPGSTVWNEGTGKAEFTAPAKTEAVDYNKPFLPDGTPNEAYQKYSLTKAKNGASSVSVNTGQKGFDNTLKLRGDFRSEPIYKNHQDTESAHRQISSSLKMGSPASDLAAATKIMKILDPGSVVRESELAMAMAAVGVEDKIVNAIPMLLSGQKLTPTQRKDFQNLADKLYNESTKQYKAKRFEYENIAERNGLNAPDVVGSDEKPKATIRWNAQTGKLEKVE